jgi:hypothetical protein
MDGNSMRQQFPAIRPFEEEDDIEWWNDGLDALDANRLDLAERIFKKLVLASPTTSMATMAWHRSISASPASSPRSCSPMRPFAWRTPPWTRARWTTCASFAASSMPLRPGRRRSSPALTRPNKKAALIEGGSGDFAIYLGRGGGLGCGQTIRAETQSGPN